MNDPTNEMYRNCIKQYLQSTPLLPYIFLDKLIALTNTTIDMQPNGVSLFNQSFNVKIRTENVEPLKKLTRMSTLSINEAIRHDLERLTVVSAVDHKTRVFTPETVRLICTDDIKKAIINSMVDLSHVIKEGNRSNNCNIDDYIHLNLHNGYSG